MAGRTLRFRGTFDARIRLTDGEVAFDHRLECWIEFLDTALRVEDGRVVERRRRYLISEQRAHMNGRPMGDRRANKLHGLDIVFRRRGSRIEVTSLGDPLDEDDQEQLAAQFDSTAFPIPARPLVVGERWIIGPEDFSDLLDQSDAVRVRSADLETRLVSVSAGERPIARVESAGKAIGRLGLFHSMAVDCDLEGAIEFDMVAGHPIRSTGHGSFWGQATKLGGRSRSVWYSEGELDWELSVEAVD